MSYKPILFSTPMIKPLMDGLKTMTRRIVDPQPDDSGLWNHTRLPMSLESKLEGWHGSTEDTGESRQWKAKADIGDIFWVRETVYRHIHDSTDYIYLADFPAGFNNGSTKYKTVPSIFMPKEAARIFLLVTDVKVERIRSITASDAISEGLEREWDGTAYWYKNYFKGLPDMFKRDPVNSFVSLWVTINGADSWDRNFWVWAYTFKKVEKPADWEAYVNKNGK